MPISSKQKSVLGLFYVCGEWIQERTDDILLFFQNYEYVAGKVKCFLVLGCNADKSEKSMLLTNCTVYMNRLFGVCAVGSSGGATGGTCPLPHISPSSFF